MHCKELALEAGRKWQSQETGFVHYCYHADSRDTIPIRENLCFVLALLRSRVAENILEAKGKLERLLCYQESGNFPIYLHEFPTCYDRFKSIEILPALIWILKGYHHVIGLSLKQKVEQCVRSALDYGLQTVRENSASDLVAMRLGCALLAFGEYLDDLATASQGKEFIQSVRESGPQSSWFVSEALGNLLVSLNLAHSQAWPELWKHCSAVYHTYLSVYCGPCIAEKQYAGYPEPTLLDLYLNRQLPKRLQKLHPIHLQCSLVHPWDQLEIVEGGFQGDILGKKWEVSKEMGFASSLVEGCLPQLKTPVEEFSPLRLIWGDSERPESLVLLMANVNSYTYQAMGQEIEMRMNLGEVAEKDHPKDRVEIALYCSRSHSQISIDDRKATLFKLGQAVQINGGVQILAQFDLIEGEGDFTGHIALGNRPSQVLTDYHPYDWKISLRSVRRSASCALRVKLRVMKS